MEMKNLIVTNKTGMVDWLRLKGIEGDVVEEVTEELVRDRHVFGGLPMSLAALAASVTVIKIHSHWAQRDLTAVELAQAGAELVRYVVLSEDEALAIREVASLARCAAEIADDSRYDGHYVEGLENSLLDVRTSFWGDV